MSENEPIFSILTGKDECSGYPLNEFCYRNWQNDGYASIQQCIQADPQEYGPLAIQYCCDEANTICDDCPAGKTYDGDCNYCIDPGEFCCGGAVQFGGSLCSPTDTCTASITTGQDPVCCPNEYLGIPDNIPGFDPQTDTISFANQCCEPPFGITAEVYQDNGITYRDWICAPISCCTSNLNIFGMPSGNGCYTYVGSNNWQKQSGGFFHAYMSGSTLRVENFMTMQQVASIIYYGQNPPCPLTGTYPIAGGGNATIVCGC